ncbi:response regulator [Methanosphaerula subterraneus]|uniref:response regulator n=1 Tax=Methanosphaerula subterraneus TaxID=3350244 RepID=UPI003F850C54
MTQPGIYLVEDDDVIAKTTEWRVRKLGYAFTGRAVSGKDAIEFISGHRPDLVLMDINLQGGMDGIETAAIITKSFDIPVIYLTAEMDKETIARAKLTNPKGYLVKPFDDKDLMAAIELAAR